jgi:hypothetical protein
VQIAPTCREIVDAVLNMFQNMGIADCLSTPGVNSARVGLVGPANCRNDAAKTRTEAHGYKPTIMEDEGECASCVQRLSHDNNKATTADATQECSRAGRVHGRTQTAVQ